MPIFDEEFLKTLYTKERFEDVLTYFKDEIRKRFPEWTAFNDDDFGTVLLELFAGIVDMFRFYQNVTAVESFPCLARLRESLVRHAKWFGYIPKPAGAASVDLEFTVENPVFTTIIPRGTRVTTKDGSVVFETIETLVIKPGQVKGTVGAVNATLIENERLGFSTGKKNQRFQLSQKPLVVLSGQELPYVRVWVGQDEWTQVRSLAWAAEAGGGIGTAFKVEIEADDSAYVVFGDGIFGKIPPEGEEIRASYYVGGGPQGNVGPNSLTRLVGNLHNVKSVTNPAAARGGYPRESEEELRENIPSQVITRGRAVTREDYKRLLRAFGEIEKISVRHPKANVVEIYILSKGGGLAPRELKERVARYLDNIRMITEDVRILDPALIPVDIAAKVWPVPMFNGADVARECEAALKADLEKSYFARALYPSDVYNILLRVPGVAKVDLDLLARQGKTGVEPVIAKENELLVPGNIFISAQEAVVS
jgi:hypothetical protein